MTQKRRVVSHLQENNLDLEILRANAYLRAWRAYGVPVLGQWVKQVDKDRPVTVALSLDCGACPNRRGLLFDANPYFPHLVTWAFRAFSLRLPALGCEHLDQMLKPPPAEIEAIAALELLAGQ